MKTIGKVALILAAVFLVSSVISILTGPIQLFSGFESASVSQFEKASIQGINLLDINVPDPDVNIYPVKGSEFLVNLTGDYAKNGYAENVNLSVEKFGETVKVRIVYPNKGIILINRNLNLNIGVPESYLGEITTSTSSGDIQEKDVNLKNFEMKTSSGDIIIINSSGKENFAVTSVSGDISLNEVKSENIKAESISGKIKAENLVAKADYFKSVSGDIEITSSENINSVKTTSGEIKIRDYLIKNDLNVESVSGEVNLELVKESSVNLRFESVSGELENNFGDVYNGDNKINVKTTSGDLIVSGINP